MLATLEEVKQVVETFERTHPLLIRALADLQLRGNIVHLQHDLLDSSVDNEFGEFIITTLNEDG